MMTALTQPPNAAPRIRDSCPNCRGRGVILTIWDYVDPALLYQVVGQGVPYGRYVATEPPPEQELGLSESRGSNSPRNSDRSSSPRSGRHVVDGVPYYTATVDGDGYPVMTDVVGGGVSTEAHIYHARTHLRDGRPSLVVDCGSVGNLCGEEWARAVSEAAKKAEKTVFYTQRTKTLNVRGVGPEASQCTHDLTFPIALKKADGSGSCVGAFISPTIPALDMPGLLGLSALRKNRAILDCNTLQLHFCGPGDYHLEKILPPGTETYQMEIAPSGHLVLPCCEYSAPKSAPSSSASPSPPLVLITDRLEMKRQAEAAYGAKPSTARKLPPPPTYSPRLGGLSMAEETPAPLADPPGLSSS